MRLRLGLALVLALVTASCGIPLDSSPRSISVGSAGQPASESPEADGTNNAYLYFVKNDQLDVALRMVDDQSPAGVLKVLMTGPTADDSSKGLISQIPTGTRVRSVTGETEPTLRVSLSHEFQNVIGTANVEAIAQMVFTVTEVRPKSWIEFIVDGQVLKVSSPTRGDVERVRDCDFVSLLPAAKDATGHLQDVINSLKSCPKLAS